MTITYASRTVEIPEPDLRDMRHWTKAQYLEMYRQGAEAMLKAIEGQRGNRRERELLNAD